MTDPADGMMLHPDRVQTTAGNIAGIAERILDELETAAAAPALAPADFGNLSEDEAIGRLHAELGGDALRQIRTRADRLAEAAEALKTYSQAVVNQDHATQARLAVLHRPR